MGTKFFEREFWVPVVTAVLGILTAAGVLGPDDDALWQAIQSLALIVLPALAYIVMRIWQKIAADNTAAYVKVETVKAEAVRVKADAQVQVAKAETKAAIATATPPVETPTK
jgi:hypothetical protein